MNNHRVSVVVLTKNESTRIRDCLKTVIGWSEDVIVVDDMSDDETRDIARSLGAHVITKEMRNEGEHRNWAYAQAQFDWVLSLDADERVTPELRQEISQKLDSVHSYAGFSIPRKNFIGKHWIRYGGQYPAAQLKLFRKDKFKYEEVQVHPRAFLGGECGHLRSDIIHFSYRDFGDFLQKLNRQTTLEAEKWIDAERKISFGHALWRTFDRFFRKFIRKQGFRDGFVGFMVAAFDSIYQIISYAKYWELKQRHVR